VVERFAHPRMGRSLSVDHKQQSPETFQSRRRLGLCLLALTARLGSGDDRLLNGIQVVLEHRFDSTLLLLCQKYMSLCVRIRKIDQLTASSNDWIHSVDDLW
jgi:hypothetical protein